MSKPLKEIALIAKNRGERRQRQADEKAYKDALLNQEQGNPYWEFQNMINEYRYSYLYIQEDNSITCYPHSILC